MNHDVLDIIKVFFHLSMNALCNLMSICEGLISIDGDLCINIDLIAEHSGMKHIQPVYPILSRNKICQFFLVFTAACGIQHFGNSIF